MRLLLLLLLLLSLFLVLLVLIAHPFPFGEPLLRYRQVLHDFALGTFGRLVRHAAQHQLEIVEEFGILRPKLDVLGQLFRQRRQAVVQDHLDRADHLGPRVHVLYHALEAVLAAQLLRFAVVLLCVFRGF